MNDKTIKKAENSVEKTYDEYIPPQQDMNDVNLFTEPGSGEYFRGTEIGTKDRPAENRKKAEKMLKNGCSAEETLKMLRHSAGAGVPAPEKTTETEKKVRSDETSESEKQTAFKQKREDKFRLLGEIADEIASELPAEIYSKLSGGIVLNENIKLHEKSDPLRPLYILGEYINSSRLGRHIALYGGSILKVYGNMGRSDLKKQLERIIKHELTHHWESLSGLRDLEIYDAVQLEDYKEDIARLSGKNKK